MSVRTIAVCDVCGSELELKWSGPLSEAQYERDIRMEGWWQREDAIRDVCSRHPSPVLPSGGAT